MMMKKWRKKSLEFGGCGMRENDVQELWQITGKNEFGNAGEEGGGVGAYYIYI